MNSVNQKVKQNGFSTIIRIFGYLKEYRIIWLIGTLLLGIDVLFNIGIAKVQQLFIDTINELNIVGLVRLVNIFSIISVLVMILTFIGYYLRFYTFFVLKRNFQIDVFNKVNRLPFSYIQMSHSGDILSRVTNDVNNMCQVLGSNFYSVLENIAQFIVAFFYLSSINLALSIGAVISGLLIYLSGNVFNKAIRNVTNKFADISAEIRGLIQEIVQGITIIKVFGLKEVMSKKYDKIVNDQVAIFRKRVLLNVYIQETAYFLRECVWILGVFFICVISIKGSLSIGVAITFMFLISQVQWPFVNLSWNWGELQKGLGSAQRVFDILDEHEEPCCETTDENTPINDNGSNEKNLAIEVKNLYFSYSDSMGYGDKVVFEDLNLNIRPGEVVALVGPSGSGKTTLARLICGLYNITHGDIEVFGKSIRNDLQAVRKMITYVPQNSYLFSGTIRENISYGSEDATIEEVLQAAKAANASEFIEKMDKEYDSFLSERGVSISGGQRQRIAIARALLRNSPLIILDEPTSSLDNENDKIINRLISKLLERKTAIIITHKLSTIYNADRIIVIDKGRVIEQGTHNELISKNGYYKYLYEFQDSKGN